MLVLVTISTDQDETQTPPVSPHVLQQEADSVESGSGDEHPGASRRARIQWRLVDPVIATLARWADEDPVAIRRLLEDTPLRWQLLEAVRDVMEQGGCD